MGLSLLKESKSGKKIKDGGIRHIDQALTGNTGSNPVGTTRTQKSLTKNLKKIKVRSSKGVKDERVVS
jgi:hypothetical protein